MTLDTKPTPPATEQRPVRELLHGRENVDPYRWLEDGDDPEVRAWAEEQNAYTQAVLDRPGRAAIAGRLAAVLKTGVVGAPAQRGNRYFYVRREGEQNQPLLYVRDGLNGADRVLLDPNTASETGIVALDWWYASRDGRLVAYGYSQGGDEKSTLYVIDVDSGELLPDTIPYTRYSSLAWEPDGGGFYYTRRPEPGAVPAGEENYHCHVFHHRLGAEAADDPKLFGEGREMTEMPAVHLSPGGRWLVVVAQHGWSRTEVHVRDLEEHDGAFVPVVSGLDALFHGEVHDDTLYLYTNLDAPNGRVIAIDLTRPGREQWREIVAERADVILEPYGLSVAGGRLALHETKDVVAQVGVYTLDGEPAPSPRLPELSAIEGMRGEWDSDDVFIRVESYSLPPAVLRYHFPTAELSTWASVEPPPGMPDIEARQVFYESKDGTRVPMFIVGRKDATPNVEAPTVLSGYGGFNVGMTPMFAPRLIPWIERGGIVAFANLRGGNEYGEEWHRAGKLERKQNVFDDFSAAAEYLVREGYTNKQRLAISGGSNGGLLVGATMTQRPDLCRAVVCRVPLLDMLRYHHFRIAKLWVPEYGSADDPEQIEFLWAYSPYHNVRPDADYPALLLTAGESDGRVDPLHARKMAALLQGVDRENPVLLRVEMEAGHGQGKPLAKVIEEETDVWTFLGWQLGVDWEAGG